MAPGGKMNFGPGDRIGDYEVLAPLGAGGMGSVYKVRHAISQRIEALKVILPSASPTPGDGRTVPARDPAAGQPGASAHRVAAQRIPHSTTNW